MQRVGGGVGYSFGRDKRAVQPTRRVLGSPPTRKSKVRSHHHSHCHAPGRLLHCHEFVEQYRHDVIFDAAAQPRIIENIGRLSVCALEASKLIIHLSVFHIPNVEHSAVPQTHRPTPLPIHSSLADQRLAVVPALVVRAGLLLLLVCAR